MLPTKCKRQILSRLVATLMLLATHAIQASTTISDVDVGSLKLSGSDVSLQGNNVPTAPTCLGDELTFNLDTDPGGQAFYAMLLAAQATGGTFDVSYDDVGGMCTIVSITLN